MELSEEIDLICLVDFRQLCVNTADGSAFWISGTPRFGADRTVVWGITLTANDPTFVSLYEEYHDRIKPERITITRILRRYGDFLLRLTPSLGFRSHRIEQVWLIATGELNKRLV